MSTAAPKKQPHPDTINSLKALEKSLPLDEMSRTDGFLLHHSLVVPQPGFNARTAFMDEDEYFAMPENAARVRMFADAYKEGKYVPNILVKVIGGVAYIRDGYTRKRGMNWAIAEGALIQKIFVTEMKGDDAEQALVVINGNNGAPVSVLSCAVQYQLLESWGWSIAEMARRSNVTPEAVRFALSLLDLPLPVKVMIQKNEVSATTALEQFNEHGNDVVEILAEAVKTAKAALPVKAADDSKSGEGEGANPAKKKRALVTKKHLKATAAPKMNKKMVTAMHTSLSGLTSRLDSITPSDDGQAFLMKLTSEDVALLRELAGKLPQLTPKGEEKNENQEELSLE
ncbi:hypothetical protein P608_18235 [Comamonas thiooxydans]|uniref:Chromosome partitioning protein ParB n=1 Tax=Comamonas thiooxydans TaxID=363952 RepID=A0A0E3CEH7_9BURK|nr:hypothetical protein [Comamonas thiooxydans]KGH08310.1 hypothetical protein P608_18235 [Comamonas thiooxydans]KGH10877.1 hypothetical protein P607_25800 [Comamonas thiooxydans]